MIGASPALILYVPADFVGRVFAHQRPPCVDRTSFFVLEDFGTARENILVLAGVRCGPSSMTVTSLPKRRYPGRNSNPQSSRRHDEGGGTKSTSIMELLVR